MKDKLYTSTYEGIWFMVGFVDNYEDANAYFLANSLLVLLAHLCSFVLPLVRQLYTHIITPTLNLECMLNHLSSCLGMVMDYHIVVKFGKLATGD